MAEPIEIDSARALTLLREVVKGREDFVYEIPIDPETEESVGTCVYARNGEPSCLVGQALHRAGVTVEELEGMDNNGMATAIAEVCTPERVTLTDGARGVFAVAQDLQDCGRTWLDALRIAEREASFLA